MVLVGEFIYYISQLFLILYTYITVDDVVVIVAGMGSFFYMIC